MPQRPVNTNEPLRLTERDSLMMLDLLEKPQQPGRRLMTAAYAMPKLNEITKMARRAVRKSHY